MTKATITIVMALFGAFGAEAQEVTKPRYCFTFNSGMLAGEPGGTSITYSASTVHGVVWNKWRVGGGIGFDSYEGWQTMPLFGQVSYDLFIIKENAVYIQGSYGWSHGWIQKPEWQTMSSVEGGRTYNAMVGYRIASGNMRISMAMGYKYQRTTSNIDNFWGDWGGYSTTTEQGLHRMAVTIGVGFR